MRRGSEPAVVGFVISDSVRLFRGSCVSPQAQAMRNSPMRSRRLAGKNSGLKSTMARLGGQPGSEGGAGRSIGLIRGTRALRRAARPEERKWQEKSDRGKHHTPRRACRAEMSKSCWPARGHRPASPGADLRRSRPHRRSSRLAKTLAVRLGESAASAFSALQSTADLMPADVMGTNIFNMRQLVFPASRPFFYGICSSWTD